jgi:hypothetical protein
MREISTRGNREVPWLPIADGAMGRIGKASGRNPMMVKVKRMNDPRKVS